MREPVAARGETAGLTAMGGRVFPRFARWIDPRLRAEEENAIFQAFLQRRRTHQIPLFVRLKESSMALCLAAAASLEVGIVLFPDAFEAVLRNLGPKMIIALAVVFLASLLYMLTLYFRRRKQVHFRLPTQCSQVLTLTEVHPRQFIDLWMTGCGAREIVEALYLEGWSFCLRIWAYVSLLSLSISVAVAAGHFQRSQTLGFLALGVALVTAAVLSLTFLALCPLGAWISVDSRRSMLVKYRSYPMYMVEALVGTAVGIAVLFALLGASMLFREFLSVPERVVTQISLGERPPLDFLLSSAPMLTVLFMLLAVAMVSKRLADWLYGLSRRKIEVMLVEQVERLQEKGSE